MAALVLIVCAGRVEGAGVDVLEWILRTDVEIGATYDERVDTTLANPLQHTYLASVQDSIARSVIDTAWDEAGHFHFLVEGEHAQQGGDDNYCWSAGNFELIPDVDSVLTIDAEYNYALGAGDRRTEFVVGVYRSDTGAPVYSEMQRASLVAGDPQQGTHSADAVVPLDAGVGYIIGYDLELRSFSGSASDLSHGSGYANFSIAPVPEPACVLLLTFPMSLLVVRRRRRC